MVSQIHLRSFRHLSTYKGDKFSVDIVDLWSSCSPWPFCEMPKSYFFLVKNPWLWRMNFRCSEPRFMHEVMFKVSAANHSK
jgi:1,2-diacylglycerol 3-beta-galactosyltransferase